MEKKFPIYHKDLNPESLRNFDKDNKKNCLIKKYGQMI
jgi:hypothetical protein